MSQWRKVCALEEIPVLGARVVESESGRIALFRTAGDEVFALADRCPHHGGPLSQGIVCGRQVTCPMHGWRVGFADGQAIAPDEGAVATFAVKVEAGVVFLQL
ncbi:MAG TPA: nitrite reductase (NAD(P)H) small subunit [Betaproteobacteria bacterium]|nr:nitrite reductase (NAD(P)H) small subunit [Betaproteobacteria bacterium]